MQTNNQALGFQQEFYTTLPDCYVEAESALFASPSLIFFNQDLADTLKASFPKTDEALAELLSGQVLSSDAKPIAQAYAGHQFGHFNPQLGDGRAMILGELLDEKGGIHELDLKGSGATPFSRGGDGKAALGPMLREVLISEAMHALGVATTRSLAVVATGEQVYRSPPQPGAVLCRTASSHIRIGTFQFFAARDQYDVVEKLVQFCIKRHYPELSSSQTPALSLLKTTIKTQAELIAKWMGLGFIHGVMNTDNMLVGGETIDYGPCAFMDVYDENTVFSSIDQNSRYAYVNQAPVAQWNLSRFAETLLPLIDEGKDNAIALATEAVRAFNPQYSQAYRAVMCKKLALVLKPDTEAGESKEAHLDTLDSIIYEWTSLLKSIKLDWTQAHYFLTQYLLSHQADKTLLSMSENSPELLAWLNKRSLHSVPNEELEHVLNKQNPAVIPRNHLVEEALDAASYDNDFAPFQALLGQILKPYDYPSDERYAKEAPIAFTEGFATYCGT